MAVRAPTASPTFTPASCSLAPLTPSFTAPAAGPPVARAAITPAALAAAPTAPARPKPSVVVPSSPPVPGRPGIRRNRVGGVLGQDPGGNARRLWEKARPAKLWPRG